jgi:hypothetical protein
MYRATVFLSTSWPSFANSLAMRRRLHSGFSLDIRLMSATIPASSGGRPTRRDLLRPKAPHTIASSAMGTVKSSSKTIGRSRRRFSTGNTKIANEPKTAPTKGTAEKFCRERSARMPPMRLPSSTAAAAQLRTIPRTQRMPVPGPYN